MPRGAPDAGPTEIVPFPCGRTPADGRAYFEMRSWFVFGAGINGRVMRARWPASLKAFRQFGPAKVARFGERDVDRLLADAGIVRNGKKITGAIENARVLRPLARGHGGMTPSLRSSGRDVDALLDDVRTRFRHMGAATSRLFLACAGALEYPGWKPADRRRRRVVWHMVRLQHLAR